MMLAQPHSSFGTFGTAVSMQNGWEACPRVPALQPAALARCFPDSNAALACMCCAAHAT